MSNRLANLLGDVVLFLSWYLSAALVPWPPRAFPACWFINSHYVHVMFERSTDSGWQNLSGTSPGCLGGLLEQIAWVMATQRQEKNNVNN